MNDRCAEFRERLPLMLSGGLSEQEKAGLVLHLADCAECSDYLERLEADDLLLSLLVSRLEDSVGRVEEGVLALIRKEIEPARPPGAIIESRRDTERSRPPGAIIERPPKRWPRYAAAAAVILGALLIWSPFGRSPLVPVAWAEVIQRVADARNYICRVRSDIYLPNSPSQETIRYVSADHGMRQDIYQRGELEVREYFLPGEGLIILGGDGGDWARIQLRDTEIEEMIADASASRMVADLRSEAFRELGEKRINGVRASGIEVIDPEFIRAFFDGGYVRLWVDVETGWPVRMEGAWEARGREVVSFTFDGFQWNAVLPRDMFEPDIPRWREPMFDLGIPAVDEYHAIEGLRSYAEILRGRYPEQPVIMSTYLEFVEFRRQHPEGREDTIKDLERLNMLRSTFEFIRGLQKDGNDVAYYGHGVDARDYDRILLRWQLSDGNYRVVWGDLRQETVTPERLREIESGR